eukprot:986347-Amphidinium_carterae.1
MKSCQQMFEPFTRAKSTHLKQARAFGTPKELFKLLCFSTTKFLLSRLACTQERTQRVSVLHDALGYIFALLSSHSYHPQQGTAH